jgi:hypothetical protein
LALLIFFIRQTIEAPYYLKNYVKVLLFCYITQIIIISVKSKQSRPIASGYFTINASKGRQLFSLRRRYNGCCKETGGHKVEMYVLTARKPHGF